MAAQGASQPKRRYSKDNTVIIDVIDNKQLKANKVIGVVTELCGEGTVFACVPKSGNLFEVTLEGRAGINLLLDGVQIDGKTFQCHDVTKKFTLVSFLHLPAYIDDMEIKEKLEVLGVELLSPIKRRFYKGTAVADGTRYLRVKLPPNLKSLPYTMKFGNEYYRVIHDNQMKVCSLCYSDGHLFKECPQFVCFKCGGQGHFRKVCKTEPCTRCGEIRYQCDCSRAARRIESLCDRCGLYECECFNTGDNQYDKKSVANDGVVGNGSVVNVTESRDDNVFNDAIAGEAVADDGVSQTTGVEEQQSGVSEVDSGDEFEGCSESHGSDVETSNDDIESDEEESSCDNNDMCMDDRSVSRDNCKAREDVIKVAGDENNCDMQAAFINNLSVSRDEDGTGDSSPVFSGDGTPVFGDVFSMRSTVVKPLRTKFWRDDGSEKDTNFLKRKVKGAKVKKSRKKSKPKKVTVSK